MGNNNGKPNNISTENVDEEIQTTVQESNHSEEPFDKDEEILANWDELNDPSQIEEDLLKIKDFRKNMLEWEDKKKEIVRNLRALANLLSKVHTHVVTADQVGTGVGIGGGILFIGGLIAAPFTAGLSTMLCVAGTGTSVAGRLCSFGANLTEIINTKVRIEKMITELEAFGLSTEQLSTVVPSVTNSYNRIARFCPTLESLAKFSEKDWTIFLASGHKFLQYLKDGNVDGAYELLGDNTIEPQVKNFIRSLPSELKMAKDLEIAISQVVKNVSSIRNGIVAYKAIQADPIIAKNLENSTKLTIGGHKASSMTHDAIQPKSLFKGSPVALSGMERALSGVLAALFLTVDVVHLIKISREKDEISSVIALRETADKLENNNVFTEK